VGSSYLESTGKQLRKYMAAGFCLVGVFFTYTRAAWVAVGLAFFLLQFGPFTTFWEKIRRFAVITAGLSLVSIFILLPPTETARRRSLDEGTIYFRINLWATGLKMAAAKPLLGHGFGAFGTEAEEYQVEVSSIPSTPTSVVVHNILLSVLIEYGCLGLFLYMLINLQIYLKAKHAGRLIWQRKGILWVVAFMLVYFFNGQFVHLQEATSNILFYGTLGLISGLRSSIEPVVNGQT